MKNEEISIDLQLFGADPEENSPDEADETTAISADDGQGDVLAIAEEYREKLEREAPAVKEKYPDFDLERESQNPVFTLLTSHGHSIEEAYCAARHKQILESAVREAVKKNTENIATAIRSGSRRPKESGGSSQAPSTSVFDYSKASKAQREAFKKDLRTRMARGEKVYPTR